MEGFVENWVEDTARGRIVRSVGLIESEYPAHTGSAVASGFRAPASASCSILLSIPSATWFKEPRLWITNNNTVQNVAEFYLMGSAGDASATIGGIRINPLDTVFIDFPGLVVGEDIWVSCLVASLEVRIAGILCQSGPERA